MKNSKKRLARLLCAAMAAAMVLAGCNSSGGNSSGGNSSSSSAGQGGEEQVLNIYTWADYFPADIVEEFTSTTGIKVNYSTFESNEEMLMKLEAAKGGQYDLILASDYIIETAIQKELVGKLDTQQIPNFQNINPAFQSKYYDPTNEYTVPYAAGIPLIIYNPELVDFEIKGFEDLWNPQLADSIVVMDDARNVIGLTLKSMGYSLNETDEAVLGQAKEKLMALKPNIRALDYSTPYNLMISGETAVGYMFTSQIITALNENPDLKVVYPEEGLGFGIDRCAMMLCGTDSIRDVILFPTMKPLDSDKKVSKEVSAPTEAAQAAPEVPEKIDFSNVQIEPLFQDQVDFDTFSKSDFRAVKVKECEAVKKSKKLLKFVLDDGTGTDRVILSGIHEYYEPEELVGKTCIAITNLPPRAMMGIDSCGMLISAVHHENGEEKLHLLMVDPHIPAGAKLY